MRVSIVGSGRVASVLGEALREADAEVVAVVGRNELRRTILAKQLGTEAYSFGEDLPESDIVLIAVSDDAIAEVSKQISTSGALIVHTSGTKGIEQLHPHSKRAVLWPVQSLTQAPFDLSDVPLVVEGSSDEATSQVQQLASLLSNTVVEVPLEKRVQMHLAAVLVSNFPVHLMAQAGGILEQNSLDPDLLLPLWNGMAARVAEHGAKAELTGPARRGDAGTIVEHLQLLENDPLLKDIYSSISKGIHEKFHGKADL